MTPRLEDLLKDALGRKDEERKGVEVVEVAWDCNRTRTTSSGVTEAVSYACSSLRMGASTKQRSDDAAGNRREHLLSR